MTIARRLPSDSNGASAVEFALIAPVLILFIVGIAQLGTLFMANAGLRSAVAEGARFATIFPRPAEEDILAKVADSRFGLDPDRLTTQPITYGVADGANYAIISVSYDVPLDFIFFSGPSVTLTEARRAFIHPAAT